MNILLDCTLRDGGYYNDWNFDTDFVESYLKTMKDISVDYVEIGFRSFKNEGFKGPCAFCKESFLASIKVPEGLKLGAMVNASEIIKNGVLDKETLMKLFPLRKKDSKITLVRVAAHVHEFKVSLEAVAYLKSLGYTVGYNIMQIADCEEIVVKELASYANQFKLDVLYFADSMGNMTPKSTKEMVDWIRSESIHPLGIHTHDNMGLGLQNTQEAISCGVSWVDSTVTGMGRGAGNTQTELLIQAFNDREYKMTSLMSFISKKFEPLKSKYKWGMNAYYYLAGVNNIHPTFIQEMLSSSSYSEEDILTVIESLIKTGGKKFSHSALTAARSFGINCSGTFNPLALLKDKTVLILGTGPNSSFYKKELVSYIKEHSPFVIALNAVEVLPDHLVDLRVVCHPIRLLADYKEHAVKNCPLALPSSILTEEIREEFKNKEILDFGSTVKPNEFSYSETECVIPSPLVFAYALGLINAGKAKEIFLAGFDGYSLDDARHQEMQSFLNLYKGNIELCSITPTNYNIKTKSIYGM